MNALLQPILERADLPNLIAELEAYWADEQKRRRTFYEQITPNDKAEFIAGEVVMHSPTTSGHNWIIQHVFELMKAYDRKQNLKGKFGFEKLLVSLTRNDLEPDLSYWMAEKAVGFSRNQMRFPAPDFVMEVLSKSTNKTDRGIKMQDYARHGVQEYWLVDAEAETLEQYFLKDGDFELNLKASQGEVHCAVLSGLHFPIKAIFDDEVKDQYLTTN